MDAFNFFLFPMRSIIEDVTQPKSKWQMKDDNVAGWLQPARRDHIFLSDYSPGFLLEFFY